jgi:hypothetical protein
LPPTTFTVIHGYSVWKPVSTVLNSFSSGLVKNVQRLSVTGACEADGLVFTVGAASFEVPPAVQAPTSNVNVARTATNA